MNITVRCATLADASTLAEFNAAMARETEQLELNQPRLRAGTEALLSDPSKGVYYVVECDGRIAGQLMITYEWSDWRNGNIWWIQSVYVQQEFRKKGLFRALFRHVEGRARSSRDVCAIRLYVERGNESAQRVYERLGMKHSHYEMMEMDLV
jgi:GNAT superfamily N-acetyltransferase